MKRLISLVLFHPLAWLCRFVGHKDEHVPRIVLQGLNDGEPVNEDWVMCLRCGRFARTTLKGL